MTVVKGSSSDVVMSSVSKVVTVSANIEWYGSEQNNGTVAFLLKKTKANNIRDYSK